MARHIYVHVPFCARKCPYCDFFSVTDCGRLKSYFDALLKEIDLWGSVKDLYEESSIPGDMDTIYIGGGTPSVADASDIRRTLEKIKDVFGIDNAEITIEVNPYSLTLEKAVAYKKMGINRVSVGVQSLHDDVLKTLGRLHTADVARKALSYLKSAGIENISSDLITAVPGETLEGIISDARELISLGAKHISTYSLTLEEGTSFYSKYKDTIEDYISPDLEREMYHGLRDYLKSIGMENYEISNNAFPGYRSRHNSSYWEGVEYYGIGVGSHGYINSKRYSHFENIEDYISCISGISSEEFRKFMENPNSDELSDLIYVEETLTFEEKLREYPFLKLRTADGIDIYQFNNRYSCDFLSIFEEAVNTNKIKGLLTVEDGYVRLTSKGLDWANSVFSDFI